MKAELKQFHILGYDGEHFIPEDPTHFGATLDMLIGIKDSDGGDIFSATVCTPSWFSENILSPAPAHPSHERYSVPLSGRHHLFIHSFDEQLIRNAVELLMKRANADNWNDFAQRLSRDLAWEFEDYAPYSGQTL